MSNVTCLPSSKEEWLKMRMEDVTSTDVSALFGISPYLTHFELWFRKRDKSFVQIEENERMKWGNRLQSAIAEGLAEDNNWHIRPMTEYLRVPELRIGSSFDYAIDNDGILEIKNVDYIQYKKEWLEDEQGNLEAPLHIEIQVQHQLLVSGRKYAYIAALIGGNSPILLRRERNENIIKGIKQKVAEFWKSIDENKPPEPDFAVDSQFIASLYGYAEPGKFMDASADSDILRMAQEYKEINAKAKELEQKKDELKAKLLVRIGDAEKVISDSFSITAGMVAPAHIEYDRQGYRQFRINWRKEK